MRTLALPAALLLALAACRFEGDPTVDPAAAGCASVGLACGGHAGCCSYACVGGVCVPNSVPGGVCRTTDDCAAGMTCVSGQCTPGAICHPDSDTCTSNNICCSGNCVGENGGIAGTCAVNHPPVVADVGPVVQPFYASTTLSTVATDPDLSTTLDPTGDTLVYVWRLASAPAGSGIPPTWSSAAVHPSVFLAAPGAYDFTVTVTDGFASQRNRLSATGHVRITAVNLPPVVDAGADVPSLLRNHALAVSGTVFDPNLGATTVRCAWYATPPGGAETLLRAYPDCPSYAPSSGYRADVTFTPGIDDPQGDWTLRLEAFDGEFLTSDTRTVTVVNAPPVPAACPGCAAPPLARVVNLRAAGDPAPASLGLSGTATDQNGDVGTPGFAWAWTVTEHDGVALPDPLVLGTGDGTAPPFTATFEPSAVGTWAAVLRVDDGHDGVASATVVVLVEPFLRPLHPVDVATGLPFGGDIPDATYLHGTDRIAFVGNEESSVTYRLWLLDPESSPTAAVPSAALARAPVSLAVDPGGASGLVGEAGYFERVSLGGSPSTSGSFALPFTPSDVLDAGQREYALRPTGQVYELSSAGGTTLATCFQGGCTPTGTRGVAAADTLFLLDEATGILRRYHVRPNGELEQLPAGSVAGTASATDLWLSAPYGAGGASRDVVAGWGARYAWDTLDLLPPPLPFGLRSLDTSTIGTDLQGIGVSASGLEVRRIGAGWAMGAANALPLPAVGHLGTGYPTTARFAFVRTDGSAHYVVLRAFVGGKYRWYLARY